MDSGDGALADELDDDDFKTGDGAFGEPVEGIFAGRGDGNFAGNVGDDFGANEKGTFEENGDCNFFSCSLVDIDIDCIDAKPFSARGDSR